LMGPKRYRWVSPSLGKKWTQVLPLIFWGVESVHRSLQIVFVQFKQSLSMPYFHCWGSEFAAIAAALPRACRHGHHRVLRFGRLQAMLPGPRAGHRATGSEIEKQREPSPKMLGYNGNRIGIEFGSTSIYS
jgi:hypothetical protein